MPASGWLLVYVALARVFPSDDGPIRSMPRQWLTCQSITRIANGRVVRRVKPNTLCLRCGGNVCTRNVEQKRSIDLNGERLVAWVRINGHELIRRNIPMILRGGEGIGEGDSQSVKGELKTRQALTQQPTLIGGVEWWYEGFALIHTADLYSSSWCEALTVSRCSTLCNYSCFDRRSASIRITAIN